MATHSSILAWRIHGWRSLMGYGPLGRKESDTTERLHFHVHIPIVQNKRQHTYTHSLVAISHRFVSFFHVIITETS